MRIIVFGGGAIGGVIAARLARAGIETAVVARGPHLAAIREKGLTLVEPDGASWTTRIEAAEDVRTMTAGDAVLVTLKAHALAAAAEGIASLRRPGGLAVFLQNGMPWWYFREFPGQRRDLALPSLDPGGRLDRAFPPDSLAGGPVQLAATVRAPGTVHHSAAFGMTIGRPDGAADARLTALAEALGRARFAVSLPGDPREAVWTKLVVNVALNGVAVLTGASIGTIWQDAGLARLVGHLVAEASRVAAALGAPVQVDLAERRRRAAGGHKSSTLQDLEAGRPIEYEALFGAVADIARRLEVAVPHVDAIAALVRRRAMEAGCLPAG